MMCAGAAMMSGISTLVMGARAANLRNFGDEMFSSSEDEEALSTFMSTQSSASSN